MSSDEEPLDPFYINYQRRLDGLPPQQDSSKGKQTVSNYGAMGAGMDWKNTNEAVSTVRLYSSCFLFSNVPDRLEQRLQPRRKMTMTVMRWSTVIQTTELRPLLLEIRDPVIGLYSRTLSSPNLVFALRCEI